MLVVLKPGTEEQTESALRNMPALAKREVSGVMQILRESVSLQEAESALVGEMAINGKSFSIVVKQNFQFVVAGVLGDEENGTLIVEVKVYE